MPIWEEQLQVSSLCLFLACLNSFSFLIVVSSLLAISKLKMPINMVVCCAMTENMPSGHATKPGDIITAMNGKTIEVDNTDAEGKLGFPFV